LVQALAALQLLARWQARPMSQLSIATIIRLSYLFSIRFLLQVLLLTTLRILYVESSIKKGSSFEWDLPYL
jgi:hypothetical protein